MSDTSSSHTLGHRLKEFATKYPKQHGSSLKRWILFTGDRLHVTAVLLAGVFASLIILGMIWPIEYHRLVTETGMVQTIFNTLLGGVILLVSIVVAVASVGITQELTTLGEQSDRIQAARQFRTRQEEHPEIEMSPARPGQIIIASLESIQGRATELEGIANEYADSDVQEDILALTEDIKVNIEELVKTIGQVQAGSIDELLIGLDYSASWQLHETFRIQYTYADKLTDDEQAVLDELGDSLRGLMTSREYFKTLYFKREFSNLSSVLLGVSLPVIVFITYVLLALDAGLFPEISLAGMSPLAIFISLAYAIALVPYIIFTAYVLRAASVIKRTPAVGPVVLGEEYDLPVQSDVLREDAQG